MQRQCLLTAAILISVATPLSALESLPARESDTQIVERGQDFAVYQTISEKADGTQSTNRFTLLENALHYKENGEWRESEDLIEEFPTGAIARRGPNRAIFSSELNVESAFDIEAADGKRIRGGVRAIQASDFRTGNTVVLARVKDSVKAELLPPNRVLYRSAFDGLEADLILVWKHNLFSHDVLIKEQPRLPEGWDPASVRLEVVTEFQVDAEPELRSQRRDDGQIEIQDDAVIHFGAMAMIMGKAFQASADTFEVGGLAPSGQTVVKEWHRTPDGRRFLIESLSWREAAEGLKDLPPARQAANTVHEQRASALAALATSRPSRELHGEAIRLASAPYEPAGYLLDFVIVPDQGTPGNLLSGETYYIKTQYYSGSSVTFNPGCVIKYKNNANMVLYGVLSFPATNQMMVAFTSRNDDKLGAVIKSVSGESNSDGNPSSHKAAQALWIYYTTYNTVIQHARFAWAKVAIERYRNTTDTATLTITDCYFTDITGTGSAAYSGSTTSLTSARLFTNNVDTAGLTMAGTSVPHVAANFSGLLQSDVNYHVPDTQAAVGPTLVMEMIHNNGTSGNSGIAFYNKYTGVKQTIAATPLDTFFNVSLNGTRYSTNVFDPRLIYDQESERWFATALTGHELFGFARYVILAVSKGSDPVGNGASGWVEDKWVKHVIPFSGTGNDFDTLGVDANGLYVSALKQNAGVLHLACIPKAALLAKTTTEDLSGYIMEEIPIAGQMTTGVTPITFGASASDPQWFLCVDGNTVKYRLITWSGGVASVSSSWASLALPTTATPLTTAAVAPQKSSEFIPSLIDIGKVESRLTTPVSRIINGTRYIYTCRTVLVNDAGGAGTNKAAIDFIRVTTGSTPTVQNRFFYDSSTNDPIWYHYPSLTVNKYGDILIACSGSGNTEYIGAYYVAKLLSASNWPVNLTCFYPGKDYFDGGGSLFQWGHYSATLLDPNEVTMWTIQEYAETRGTGNTSLTAFGTRISAVLP